MVDAVIIQKPLCPKFPVESFLNHSTLEGSILLKNHRYTCKFCRRLPERILSALFQAEIDLLVREIDRVRPKVKQMEADGTLDEWILNQKFNLQQIFEFECDFGVHVSCSVKNRFLPKLRLVSS